jgi:hypothetical protein
MKLAAVALILLANLVWIVIVLVVIVLTLQLLGVL